jgi:hypothetical protein
VACKYLSYEAFFVGGAHRKNQTLQAGGFI